MLALDVSLSEAERARRAEADSLEDHAALVGWANEQDRLADLDHAEAQAWDDDW